MASGGSLHVINVGIPYYQIYQRWCALHQCRDVLIDEIPQKGVVSLGAKTRSDARLKC